MLGEVEAPNPRARTTFHGGSGQGDFDHDKAREEKRRRGEPAA
jgi:hypothetical protein